MDRTLFGDKSTGQLVQIEDPRKDWAFIPGPMPPKWEFPTRLWPLLAEAKEALGTLNGIGQALSDHQLLLRPLQSREALTSSSLEGTYVTPEQLLIFELDPQKQTAPSENVSDRQEVSNYNTALNHGTVLLNELPLCHRVIREMHRLLMEGVRGRHKSPGKFRKAQVLIGASGRFIPPPPSYVQGLMDDLERYMNSEDEKLDPLVRCYLVHYQFETIHPFIDGNGRVGRALLALMIYKCLGHSSPWLYMSAFFERHKEEYVQNLFKISASGDWESWIEFCLRGSILQAKDAIDRCNQFLALKTNFHERIDAASPRTSRIVDLLFINPFVTTPLVKEKFNISYPTAKADLERFVEAKILRKIEKTRPLVYFSPELMDVAYQDPDY